MLGSRFLGPAWFNHSSDWSRSSVYFCLRAQENYHGHLWSFKQVLFQLLVCDWMSILKKSEPQHPIYLSLWECVSSIRILACAKVMLAKIKHSGEPAFCDEVLCWASNWKQSVTWNHACCQTENYLSQVYNVTVAVGQNRSATRWNSHRKEHDPECTATACKWAPVQHEMQFTFAYLDLPNPGNFFGTWSLMVFPAKLLDVAQTYIPLSAGVVQVWFWSTFQVWNSKIDL